MKHKKPSKVWEWKLSKFPEFMDKIEKQASGVDIVE